MSSISPDARQLWRSTRGPVAIVLLIVVTGIAIALIRGSGEGGALDPRSYEPSGSHALARLLEAEGVRIELVDSFASARDALARGPATLLITHPERLVPQRLGQLRAAELMLVAPNEELVAALDLPVAAAGEIGVSDREPDCALEAASAAGVARVGGIRYESDTQTCYSGSLARVGTVTLLGTGTPLTNEVLDERGNAALAMRLLGRHDRLIWYVPSLRDPLARPDQRPLFELLPDGWRFGMIQIAVAVGIFALWRARRLGPVVTEPLPVVVRAAETAEGRARLYRRAGAADHAAEALRQAVRGRLIPRLGLARGAEPGAVVEAVASRTGRPPAQVHDVLYGPPPPDESALVRLADALDDLEGEIGR